MNKLHNVIALRYKQAVIIDGSNGKIPAKYILGLLLDISQLGYTLDGNAVRAARTLTETEFKDFHGMLIGTLKEMIGADVKYTALFKNFPNDIPNDDEYFISRFVGYISNAMGIVPEDMRPLACGHVIDTTLFNIDEFGVCPICQMQVDELDDDESNRLVLEDITPLKLIALGNSTAIDEIFTNLITAKSSISEEDREAIMSLVTDDPSLFTLVIGAVPMKENAALIAGLAVDYDFETSHTSNDYSQVAADVLLNNIKTATDVLRLAVQMCDGDVSLAEPTKFKLSNKKRRIIMWLLDNVNAPEEDMLRYKMRWIRLAEVIHVGKYAKKYPNAFNACDTLRNRADEIVTFNNMAEAFIDTINNFGDRVTEKALIELLVQRPGEFARRMDWMLRTFNATNVKAVATAFEGLVDRLPTKMLLTLSKHLEYRAVNSATRYFMPKGNLAKIKVIVDNRKTIDQIVLTKVLNTISSELSARFSKLEPLGNVYINEDLKGYLVPMVQRNASKSLVTIARGSRVPLTESTAVRMFLWWKENKNDTVDVDLSAGLYDADWNYLDHISYTRLSCDGGTHSGDIQSAPNGASEFIDIDIDTVRKTGARFVVMSVISFSGQSFDTFECFAGVMNRDKVASGKKYEPTTVSNKFDLAGDTRYNIPLILDLVTNQVTWADIALTSNKHSNVEGSSDSVVTMAKAIQAMSDDKPNLFDLFWLHASTRADSIDYEREEGKKYDTVFDVDMATNVDEVLGKWL